MRIPEDFNETAEIAWNGTIDLPSRCKPKLLAKRFTEDGKAKVVFLGHVLITYTPDGWHIRFPEGEPALQELYLSIIKKMTKLNIHTIEGKLFLLESQLTSNEEREVIITYNGRERIDREGNRHQLSTPKPTKIVAKSGHKTRLGDWVVARSKSGTRLFHKGPPPKNKYAYQYDNEQFHIAAWKFYGARRACRECEEKIPEDVKVLGELTNRMKTFE